jgi:branched-chain amino acid aminotransferase
MYYTDIPFSLQELEQACVDTIHANKMKACYIRPLVYRGYGDVGVFPLNNPVEVSIAVWEWGSYLGHDSLENGIDVCVSSWSRSAPNTLPTMAKAGANYANSQLIKIEAIKMGFSEGIALDVNGYVSEGSGENIFIVKDGIVYTPPVTSAILGGITRVSVMTMLEEHGVKVKEVPVQRELLSIADEVFFTGTAAEITPVRSIAKIQVGNGKPGPVTKKLQEQFFDIIRNGNDTHGWLKFI